MTPESVADLRQPAGQWHRGADQFLRFLFRTEFFRQDAAGLVVSTANCLPPQNSGGGWEFNGPPPLKSIVNYGQIKIGQGGSVFLIADQIENDGSLEAPGGTVGLAAGQTVLLSERPDGRGLSMQVTLPGGSVDNEGRLIADGGTIALNAKVVNQNGFIQANSVKNVNGTIELVASDQLTLGANSQIIASGDNSPAGSAGGNVTLKSGNTFSDCVGSQIDVTGGSQGGNGGNVEISASSMTAINSRINGQAQPGSIGGTLLLDPDYIVLGTTGSDSAGSGTVLEGSSSGSTLNLNVGTSGNNYSDSAFTGLSQITLEAKYDITLADSTTWNLSASTANFGGHLTLEAGRNIYFGNGASISDANSWAIALYAGVSGFSEPTQTTPATPTVKSGSGSIYLGNVVRDGSGNPILDAYGNGTPTTGNGFIQTASGNIILQAGQDIQVGSGFVRTTGGGAVSAWALKGDVNTGTCDQGYAYNSVSASSSDPYYQIQDGGVGGISTSGGGDVKITAGGNVISFLPSGTDNSDAGSGTFATQNSGVTGDVTIIAGGNVTGHYTVANGTGAIYAGVQMDKNGNPVTDASGNYVLNPVYTGSGPATTGNAGTADNKLALSLISGGWTVNAANNIVLQEVRNPNGIFNSISKSSASYHNFDYAADAYVNLVAGNSVTLGTGIDIASDPPRNSGESLPFIYAPILNIVAGAGGVDLTGTYSSQFQSKLGELILFPSPQGSLTLITTGDLTGQFQDQYGSLGTYIYNLVVSDSGYRQYYKPTVDVFGKDDHAATPVHYGSPTPISLDVFGNMNNVLLSAPEAAQIMVGGDMINSRFQGMNLSSDPSQTVQVQVREPDGSMGTATVQPGLTSINVLGNIVNRGDFTPIVLSSDDLIPDLSLLSDLYVDNDHPLPTQLKSLNATTLAASFFYDQNTKQLIYKNIVLGSQSVDISVLMDFLEGQPYQVNGKTYTMTVRNFDQNGMPENNLDGTPSLNENVSVLKSVVGNDLIAEYHSLDNLLGPIPLNAGTGYLLGGGGQFNITAHNIDLATSGGIQSKGVAYDYSLTKLPDFNGGANISVIAGGNLDMFATTISTANGGNININAAGEITVGSDEYFGGNAVRGIFTTAGGDVTVVAGGNINVNGSRIATYDGGNVTVASLDGNIDAGQGASTPVTVTGYYVDPYVDADTTRNVYTYSPQLPFSGILALTFPDRFSTYPAPVATLGNILVEAPNGNINANAAGILQIPLNTVSYPDANIAILAGYELLDGLANLLTAGNLPVTDDAWLQALHPVSEDRNIDASGSGIIASNARLEASGEVDGLIFARNNINISAQQNINVTALGQGNVNVSSASGTISGTIVGVGGVSASGESIQAALISANVSGATSGQSGLGQANAAGATSQSIQSENIVKTTDSTGDQDDQLKKKGKAAATVQKSGRVTVLLPPKHLSQNQITSNNL